MLQYFIPAIEESITFHPKLFIIEHNIEWAYPHLSQQLPLSCVHLILNDDQCHGIMYSCPKYANTSRVRLTGMVENPTRAVTFHWHLSW
jgi:hypothetical protein